MAAVTIPVMAKSRVGHFVEAQILEALGVDMIDESEGNLPDTKKNNFNFNSDILDSRIFNAQMDRLTLSARKRKIHSNQI